MMSGRGGPQPPRSSAPCLWDPRLTILPPYASVFSISKAGIVTPALMMSKGRYKTQEETSYPEQLIPAVGPLIKLNWLN